MNFPGPPGAGGALQPASSGICPPLNAASTAPSGEHAKVQDTKLLAFSDELGSVSYDAVKLAWVKCKMDGHILLEGHGSHQSFVRAMGRIMPGGAVSSDATTSTTDRVSKSNEQSARPKRGQDGSSTAPVAKRTRANSFIPGKYTEVPEQDDSDESEQEDGNTRADFDAQDAAQRKKVRDAERHRQNVIDSDLIKLSHGATKQSDVEWALSAILRLASMAPGEPIAILRQIVRTLPANVTTLPHGGDIGPIRKDIQLIDDKLTAWWEDRPHQDDTQTFLRALHIACVCRSVTREQHQRGKEDIEDCVQELLKLRNRKHVVALGIKVMTIAFAISPRNLTGVLLLPHLGLDEYSLQDLSGGKLVALVGLLTSNHWTLEQMGITDKHAGIVEYITNRLIPGIEATLVANVRSGLPLHPYLSSIIACGGNSPNEAWSFGLKMKYASDGVKRESPEETVWMPPLYLIDSSFKTSKADRYNREYIVSLCRNKIHLDREILSSKVESPAPVTKEIFRGWKEYMSFWKIRNPAEPVPPFHVVAPRCSDGDNIVQQAWESQNRFITFWGTLLCKCPAHLRSHRLNIDPSVLGALSRQEIEKHRHHDAQSIARYDVRDVLREHSPEPDF